MFIKLASEPQYLPHHIPNRMEIQVEIDAAVHCFGKVTSCVYFVHLYSNIYTITYWNLQLSFY